MKKDLESRRRAIIRALRGRSSPAPTEPAATEPAPTEPAPSVTPTLTPPPVDEDARVDVDALSNTVSDLATRVDELSRDFAVLRSNTTVRHHIPELPDVDEDDGPVTRASVPPVIPAKISDHAFDVLLGRR